MSHTPPPYTVKKSHVAPEIIAVNFKPTPTSKALIRRVAIVLLEGGSEGMEEAIATAEFMVKACNSHDALLKAAEHVRKHLDRLPYHCQVDIAECGVKDELDNAIALSKEES